jgi:uncharacterized membrane protein
MRTLPAGALPAAACLWLVLLISAPLALTRGAVPVGTLGVYTSASLLCHQRAERSFAVGGAQMPVCGRCFGLYLAGALGAVAALVSRRRPAPAAAAVRLALALAAAPMLLSVGLEWTGAVGGSNASRFASALPLGLAAGWFLQRTIAAAASVNDGVDALSFRRT